MPGSGCVFYGGYTKRIICSLLAVWVSISFFSSCSNNQDKSGQMVSTPRYDSLLEYAAFIYDKGDTVKSLHFMDSTRTLYDRANSLDWIKYYEHHRDFYANRLKDYHMALVYTDSMFMVIEKNHLEHVLTSQFAHMNYAKGDILFTLGDYDNAYEYYFKAKAITRETKDTCGMAYYSYRIGMVLYKQLRYREATNYFKMSIDESKHCPKDFVYFYRDQEVLDNIGLAFTKLNMNDSAINYFGEALSYLDDNSGKYQPYKEVRYGMAKGVIYGNMGTAYFSLGNYALAKKWFKMSVQINSQRGYDLLDAQYTKIKLANVYLKENKPDSAYVLLQEVRNVLNTVHDADAEMRWNNMMWLYSEHVHDDKNSISYLVRYNAISDSLASNNEAVKQIDLDSRVNYTEKEYQIKLLKNSNELRGAYLVIAVLVTLTAILIILFVFQNLIKSKQNIIRLAQLNDDVKEQKSKLERALKALEISANEKDRILRAVAHDVRSPVNSIHALTDLILADEDKVTEEQKEYLKMIKDACYSTLDLSKEILEAASSIKAENLEKEWFDLNALLKSNIELLRIKAAEKKQKIYFSVIDGKKDIFGDKNKIARVIINLVNNAIKFSPSGGEIEVSLQEKNDTYRVSIKDNGIGIPEDMKNKIFDMFTDAKRPGTGGEKPFGLGLSICKHIVDAHNGRIWCDSVVNKGTTFHVSLPKDEVSE